MDEDEIKEIIFTAWQNHMALQTKIYNEIQACRDELVALNDVIVEVDSGEEEA